MAQHQTLKPQGWSPSARSQIPTVQQRITLGNFFAAEKSAA